MNILSHLLKSSRRRLILLAVTVAAIIALAVAGICALASDATTNRGNGYLS